MFDLSEAPFPAIMTSYSPLTHCNINVIYSHRWERGGELTIEKVRGAIVHKAGRKYQYD